MRLKTIPFEFWKAQLQSIMYLLKFGKYNVKFEQVRDLKIHYEKSSWTLHFCEHTHVFSMLSLQSSS